MGDSLSTLSTRKRKHHVPSQPRILDNSRKYCLVVIDPQNDFLSPKGVAWGVVGQSVTENRTVENLDSLFRAALDVDMQVFVSPHYYYPHDHQWRFEGALETLMHNINMFDRHGPLDLQGLADSGADWLEQFKPYIDDGKAVVVSPHKVFGPETNDLTLQLRKRNISKVLLAGMSANLCVESHMCELIEQGFEVGIAWDATAAARLPEWDGMAAAKTNFRMIASESMTTADAVDRIRSVLAVR